jgi:hypothetical protein
MPRDEGTTGPPALDRVSRYPAIPQPDSNAPSPILLCDEAALAIAYWTSEGSVALVRFEPVEALRFGAPNDESRGGHPLAGRGLEPSGAFIVENSSWILELAGVNSVHPTRDPAYYSDLVHFVITFRDATFECVARRSRSATHPAEETNVWSLLRSSMSTAT